MPAIGHAVAEHQSDVLDRVFMAGAITASPSPRTLHVKLRKADVFKYHTARSKWRRAYEFVEHRAA